MLLGTAIASISFLALCLSIGHESAERWTAHDSQWLRSVSTNWFD